METQTKIKLSAGYFFLSLGVLTTLIASVVSFLNLAFEILNKKFPDVLNAMYQYGYNTYQFDSARTALATLIIVFPALLVLVHFWRKVSLENLSETERVIRKWMIYVVLFLSAAVILIDLITLVKYFVGGQITIRFILKVLVAGMAAKMIIYYFAADVFTWRWGNILRRISAWVSPILVIALIVWSFFIIGSPMDQRKLQLDQRRTDDLQNIQWQIISYWQQKEKLPASFADMKDPISSYMVPVDPEFQKGNVYEYTKTGNLSFELCATFSLPMPEGWQEYNYGKGGGVMPMTAERDVAVSYPYPGGGGMNESWDHEAGRTCFARTIDPEIYPPYPKPDKE